MLVSRLAAELSSSEHTHTKSQMVGQKAGQRGHTVMWVASYNTCIYQVFCLLTGLFVAEQTHHTAT